MKENVIETIEREAKEATTRFANKFHNGDFEKFESNNHGPDYGELQSGEHRSLLREDEVHFMEFLNSSFAKKLMRV